MPKETPTSTDPVAALASLGKLRSLNVELDKHEKEISKLQDSITAKTVSLEDLRSEKRILQAERDDALKRLLIIQRDLKDVTKMEKKVAIETQTLERNLVLRKADEEYVQIRAEISEIRQQHELPALAPHVLNRDEENTQYLKDRLDDRRQEQRKRIRTR